MYDREKMNHIKRRMALLEQLTKDTQTIPYNWEHDDNSLVISYLVPGLGRDEISLNVDSDGFFLVRTSPQNPSEGTADHGFDVLPSAIVGYIDPDTVDFEKVESILSNGILKVRLPLKKEQSPSLKSRKIEIG